MRNYKSIIGSIGGGVVITLITGLYSSTPGGLVGAAWYGFPLVWLRKLVIAPQYNPWRVDITGLIVDLVVWILIIEVLYLAARTLETNSVKKPRRKR